MTSIVTPIGGGGSKCGYCKNKHKKDEPESIPDASTNEASKKTEISPTDEKEEGKEKEKESVNAGHDDSDANDSAEEEGEEGEEEGTSKTYGKFKYGMWGHMLTCQDYQDLIDRGWRRSGKYLYKPDMAKTCCPQYTIRLDVHKFEPSKSHKKVIKKVRKYLSSPKDGSGSGKDGDEAMKESADVEKQGDTKGEAGASSAPIPTESKESAFVAMMKDVESHTTPSSNELNVTIVPAIFEQDTFDLYRKYQTTIHKDNPSELTPKRYKNFLVESPLIYEPPSPTIKDDEFIFPGYGSFHQKYYLNDRLIAVGFIDILPSCVSSVYFIYDPDFAELSLGVYSALRETRYTAELSRVHPNLHYYYMGYYIHNCEKMKYKAQYKPSDLLCPVDFVWVPFEYCSGVLDAAVKADEEGKHDHRPVKLSVAFPAGTPESDKQKVEYTYPSPSSIPDTFLKERVLVFVGNGRVAPLKAIPGIWKDVEEREKIREWVAYVGQGLASKMVVYPT